MEYTWIVIEIATIVVVLFVASLIVANLTILKLYKKFGESIPIRFIPQVIVKIAFAFLLFSTTLSSIHFFSGYSLSRHSPVCVAPLETLDTFSIGCFEDAFLFLADNEYIRISSVREFSGGGRSAAYSASWISETSPLHSMSARLSITLVLYNSRGSALPRMSGVARRHPRHQRIEHEDIDIILVRPFIPTGASSLYLPFPERYIITEIRIGSAIITLGETRDSSDMRNDYSSQFIRVFVNALQELYHEQVGSY